MKRLGLLLLLLSGAALAQGVQYVRVSCPSCSLSQGALTLSSSTNALILSGGGKICLDGSSCSDALSNSSGTALFSSSLQASSYYITGVTGPSFQSSGGSLGINGGVNFASSNITGTAGSGTGFTIQTTTSSGSDAFILNTTQTYSGGVLLRIKNNGTSEATVDYTGAIAGSGFSCSGATHCGSAGLTTGSTTVTVVSGCHPICTDTSTAAAVKCSVASTTLTITGSGSDVIDYFCF